MNRRSKYLALGPAFFLLATLIAIASFTAVEPATAGEIPPVLHADLPQLERTYPIFVSAEAAFTTEGEFVESLFHPHLGESLQRNLRSLYDPTADCVVYGMAYDRSYDLQDRSTLEKALLTAEFVFRGVVTSAENGFDRALPGQLLRIKPVKVLRGKTDSDFYYAFIPRGNFTAGPFKICKTDPRFAATPEVGQEVLVMPARPRTPGEAYLDLSPVSLISVDSEGHLSFPKYLREGVEESEPLPGSWAGLDAVLADLCETEAVQ